jgi:cathepsin D
MAGRLLNRRRDGPAGRPISSSLDTVRPLILRHPLSSLEAPVRYALSLRVSRLRGSSFSATGTNELINHNQDSSYFGSLAIGTPAQAYNVILDTGSADLWIASSSCSVGCNGISKFNQASSTSYKNLSTPFDITYGSGRAQGSLGQDTVQMAGFSVANQNFGIVDTVSAGLLTSPVSGLLGLGFKTISSSRSTPFWQTLVESGAWDQPVMSFYLSRFINATHAKSQEPGGRFTMGEHLVPQSKYRNRFTTFQGFVDQSLYTGQIEYIDIPNGQEGYWILPLTGMQSEDRLLTASHHQQQI